jgi:hypothetical protein
MASLAGKRKNKKKQKANAHSLFLKNANPPMMPMSAVGRQQHESGVELPAAAVVSLPASAPSKSAPFVLPNIELVHCLPTALSPSGQPHFNPLSSK